MKKEISTLSISKRFLLIKLAVLLVIGSCTFLVWRSAITFKKNQEMVSQLSDFENKMMRMRSNYNGIKADMVTSLMADPVSQKQHIIKAEALFNLRMGELQKDLAEADINGLPAVIIRLRNEYYDNLKRYLSFCVANLKPIQNASAHDSVNFSNASKLMVEEIDNYYTPLLQNAMAVVDAINLQRQNSIAETNHDQTLASWLTSGICIALLVLIILLLNTITTTITEPVKQVQQTLEEISAGKLPAIKTGQGMDELSAMQRSLGLLNSHLHQLVDFADHVANKNFDVKAAMFDGNGPIAGALANMRENLKAANVSERQRNWSSEGLTRLSEIINQQDKSTVALEVVRFLTHYVNAQQGGLFILRNDEKDETIYLQLEACYAFERKKFIEKKVNPGEGLVGQAYLEGETILLTKVPDNYIKITSGLGTANPSCLVVLPMKYNGQVEAVFELASFKILQKHEVEFLEKAGEFIASAIVNSKTTSRMQKLLDEAHQQAEILKAQEEEMRQNMEEMAATQEEITRSNAMTERLLQEQREQVLKLRAQEEELKNNQMEMELIQQKEKERAAIQINSQKEMMAKLLDKQKETEKSLRERIQELETGSPIPMKA